MVRGSQLHGDGNSESQAEETASEKVLRWEGAWYVGKMRKTSMCDHS